VRKIQFQRKIQLQNFSLSCAPCIPEATDENCVFIKSEAFEFSSKNVAQQKTSLFPIGILAFIINCLSNGEELTIIVIITNDDDDDDYVAK
jgi:hypothetical protein